MRWRALAVVIALGLGACTHASGPSYPLHPHARSASGGPIEILGAVANPGVIPYSVGITLRTALRLAGGPTALALGPGMLTRVDHEFVLPVRDIVAGAAPDLELAPGDRIVVAESE
jgi:protein involved in polysaccharide export with SLBB domain